MSWITTNLRLPEDLYMELKMKAAKERKSVAAIIREKLLDGNTEQTSIGLLQKMKKLGNDIAKENKGLNLSKGLIESRYEQ